MNYIIQSIGYLVISRTVYCQNGRILHSSNRNKSQSYLSNAQIKNICLRVKNGMNTVIFPAGSASQGALNEDYSVGLDGARPANTCIPPSFPPLQSCGVPTPKNTFANIKKISRKRVPQTHFLMTEFVEHKIQSYH